MKPSPSVKKIRRLLNQIRVENVQCKKFIPEDKLFEVLFSVKEDIRQIFKDSIFGDERGVVNFIFRSARRVFSVLILIDHISYIQRFIRYDQLQDRSMDHMLPFDESKLRQILFDETVAGLFYEKQWELCAPVFLGDIMSRKLDPHTIMPYLKEQLIASGAYGSVYKVQFHSTYRPKGYKDTVEFVRKEQKLDDTVTYENEVRVLSTLQRLAHPNILRLVACYTHDGKHNLVSPFIAGGTLRDLLSRDRPASLTREKLLCSMAGLASAIWALHVFTLDDDIQSSYKGHHQDLWGKNILVDGDRLILADFGISSIKKMNEDTPTRFKGRIGYYQAPECADLDPPYSEHKSSRASDIFALGCIFTDILVYFAFGPEGSREFSEARKFRISQFEYRTFHKGKRLHEVVGSWLQKIQSKDKSKSTAESIHLIRRMLEIRPENRPRADEVTATIYVCAIKAFSERVLSSFGRFTNVQDAMIEKARYSSWALTQEPDVYLKKAGATAVEKEFTMVVDILNRILKTINEIGDDSQPLDRRSFLEVRALNLQLLNMLSPAQRAQSQTHLTTILLQEFGSIIPDLEKTVEDSGIGYSSIISKAKTKQLVARAEDEVDALSVTTGDGFSFITDPITECESVGQFKTATITRRNPAQTVSVFIETIKYHDLLTWQNQAPRIRALCDLLWSEDVVQNFRIPRFYGVRERRDLWAFDLVYQYPDSDGNQWPKQEPISLHKLLSLDDRRCPLESRFKLAADLAEALANFHDVNWFHKDLTSFNVMFFTTTATPPSETTAHPYLVGFQHSRRAAEDSTEGPLHDPRRQRYHHPRYVNTGNRRFTGFRPEFDRYSLGILLIEIGFWSPIETIMCEYEEEGNDAFLDIIIGEKLPSLGFWMGSRYVDIASQCLTALSRQPDTTGYTGEFEPASNVLFKQAVVAPLRSLATRYEHLQTQDNKRKRSYEESSIAGGPVKYGSVGTVPARF
ncbi:kinase-like domain-containing protein [Aspergillus terricola var. indicus]